MKFYHSGNYLNAEKKDGRQSKHVLQIITKLTAKKKKNTPVQSEEKKTDQVNQTRTEDQHSIISERYESNHQMKCSVLMYFSIRICSHYQFFGEKKQKQILNQLRSKEHLFFKIYLCFVVFSVSQCQTLFYQKLLVSRSQVGRVGIGIV